MIPSWLWFWGISPWNETRAPLTQIYLGCTLSRHPFSIPGNWEPVRTIFSLGSTMSNWYFKTTWCKNTSISMRANSFPMHVLGPPPNGTYVYGAGPWPSNRVGSKVSGFGKNLADIFEEAGKYITCIMNVPRNLQSVLLMLEVKEKGFGYHKSLSARPTFVEMRSSKINHAILLVESNIWTPGVNTGSKSKVGKNEVALNVATTSQQSTWEN